MDDSQSVEVEGDHHSTQDSLADSLLENRRKLIGYANRLTPIRDNLERLFSDDEPMELDLDELKEYKELVDKMKKKAADQAEVLFHDEVDEALREGDESRWQALQTLLRRVSSLNAKLISIKVAQSWVSEVDNQLDALVVKASTNPGLDFSKGIAGLTYAYSQLNTVLRESTIPEGHQLRKMAKEINSRIIDLTATEKVEATGGDGKFGPGKSVFPEAYKVPRIDLPKFNGVLERWNPFWLLFSEVVDENPAFTQTQKLTYLRQCITSQDLKDLLMPTSKDPGVYQQVVLMLKDRYDKPRKLHELYSRNLADLPVCRNTAEDLLAGGDRLYKAVAGLVDLGQFDVNTIGTSLGVCTLPPTLQTEWETLTQDQVKVPPVSELIAFMRKKSSNICKVPLTKPKVSVHVVESVSQVTSSPPAGSVGALGSGRTKGKGFTKQLSDGVMSESLGAVVPQGASPTQSVSPYQKPPCPVCGGNHPAYFCPAFLAKSMGQRQDTVTELNLCRNCLRVGHAAATCRSHYRCRTCNGKHNSVLHYSNNDNSSNNNSDTQVNTSAVDAVVTVAGQVDRKVPSSLLMTSQVLLTGPSGRTVVARALLDSGATLSLLSKQTMQALDLKTSDVNVRITGVENTTTSGACPLVSFSISPLHRPKEKKEVVAAVVSQATGTLPLQDAKSVADLPHIRGLQLADPNFFLPGKIDFCWGRTF